VVAAVGVPGSVYLEEVAVLPDFQHRGIGSKLVTDAVQWMGELSYDLVSVHPLGSAGWFEHLGFVPTTYGLHETYTTHLHAV